MAVYEITRVRTEWGPGASHEHISMVELSNRSDQRFSRETIIRDLRDPYGDRYYTYGGGLRADVVVRGCPYCTSGSYITTLPDTTIKNNLLELPRF